MDFFDILLAKKLAGGGDIVGYFLEGADLTPTNMRVEITTPKGVTTLVDNAFYNKTPRIVKATLTDIVTIGNYAFRSNEWLVEVKMPKVVTIGTSAFDNCKIIETIDIPSTITRIGDKAFADTRALKDFYCRATNPPTITYYTFQNSAVQNIYVPAESVNAYKSANAWNSHASKIKAIPEE